jgi:hypothetical protein
MATSRTSSSGRTPPPTPVEPAPLSAEEAQGVGEAALRAAIASLSLEPEPPQMAAAEEELAETLEEATPARVDDAVAVAMAALRAANIPLPAHAEAAITAALLGKVQTDATGEQLSAAEIQARHQQLQHDLAQTRDYSDRKRAITRDAISHEAIISYPNRTRRIFSINNVGFDVPAGLVDVPLTVASHLAQFDEYEGYAVRYEAALRLSGDDAGYHEIKHQNVEYDLRHVLPGIPDLRGLEPNGKIARPTMRVT